MSTPTTNVAKENLARALALTTRVARPKSSLPILSNVHIRADGEEMVLSCTDLSTGIMARIPVLATSEPWATTVPARTLLDLVNTLPDEAVSLSLTAKTQTLSLECGGTKTKIKGIDAVEFPPMPDVAALEKQALTFTLDSEVFQDVIGQVVFCASTDQARPVLNAVCIKGDKGTLSFDAADGFRLAKKTVEIDPPFSKPFSVLVPAAALGEAGKIAALCDKVTVIVVPNRGQVIFHSETADLITQTIEGNYPDLGQIIPKTHVTRTVASRAALLNAVKQAEIFAREGGGICKLAIIAGIGETDETPIFVEPHVTVSGQSEETGQQEAIVAANVEGNSLLIAFNVAYLKEILSAMPGGEVAIETNGDTSPGVIKPVGENHYQVVLMPMSLGK